MILAWKTCRLEFSFLLLVIQATCKRCLSQLNLQSALKHYSFPWHLFMYLIFIYLLLEESNRQFIPIVVTINTEGCEFSKPHLPFDNGIEKDKNKSVVTESVTTQVYKSTTLIFERLLFTWLQASNFVNYITHWSDIQIKAHSIFCIKPKTIYVQVLCIP